MRKFALYTYPGRESERGWPQLGGDEMEQTCERLSDWYCHADDVRFALDAKDREIAALKDECATSERLLNKSTKNIIELRAKVEGLRLCLAPAEVLGK